LSLNQTKLFNDTITTDKVAVEFCVESFKPSANSLASKAREISRSLNDIFPEKETETKIERARRILGDICYGVDDDELISRLAQFQSLIESWMDEYEKKIFDNTLEQLLRGKSGDIN